MPLASIRDLNGPPEEVAKHIEMAKELSGLYDDFILLDVEDRPRAPGIHASELYPCLRKAVYSVLGTEKKTRISKFWKQRFKVGHALHAMMQNDFHRMAKRSQLHLAMRMADNMAKELDCYFEFEDEAPVSPEHQELARHYNIHSSADGIFTFKKRDTGEVLLRVGLEIKTEAPEGYSKLKAPKPEHVRQAHIYMACLDLPLMWFFYMNKGNQNNTDSNAPWLVVWRPEVWKELEERIQLVLSLAARKELPERTETIACEFCPWSHTCQPSAQGQQSIRPGLRNPIRRPGT